ncbi:MAG: hypothetical protein DME18_17675, partial [Verrucomicrobia bacterium]
AGKYEVGSYPNSVAVGDFNGDRKPDLAVANISSGTVSVLLNSGDGTFQTAVNYNAGNQPRSVAVGDFSGDGKPDLAVVSEGGVSVLLNTCASAGIHLGLARSNSALTLSWPLTSTGFLLESTTNLSLTNWQPVFEKPRTNNSRLELIAPLDQPGRFFRLRKP